MSFDFLDDFIGDDAALETVDTSGLDNLDRELNPRYQEGPNGRRAQAGKRGMTRDEMEDRAAEESLAEIRRVAAEMQASVGAMNTMASEFSAAGGGDAKSVGGAEGVRNLAQNLIDDLEGKPRESSSPASTHAHTPAAASYTPAQQQQQPAVARQFAPAPSAGPAQGQGQGQEQDLDGLLDALAGGASSGAPTAASAPPASSVQQPATQHNPVPAAVPGSLQAESIDDILSQLGQP
jgi:hypothetical protein